MTPPSPARGTRHRRTVALAGFAGACSSTFAHEGHGLFGSHWHATDALGFVAVAAVVVVAVWWSGK